MFFTNWLWGQGSVETHRPATDLTAKMRQRVHLDFFFKFFKLLRGPHSKDQTKGAPRFIFFWFFYCWGDLTTKTRHRVHLDFFFLFFLLLRGPHSKDQTKGAPWIFFFFIEGTSQQRPNEGCTLIFFFFFFFCWGDLKAKSRKRGQ